MADGAMTPANGALSAGQEVHPVMAYIGAIWTNFAAGKTPQQKRAMIAAWESALADIPIGMQKKAIDRMVRAGQKWPPSSPAELREWCDAVQRPMDGMSAAFYRSAADAGVLDADFCDRQRQRYEQAQAEGRNAYAGW